MYGRVEYRLSDTPDRRSSRWLCYLCHQRCSNRASAQQTACDYGHLAAKLNCWYREAGCARVTGTKRRLSSYLCLTGQLVNQAVCTHTLAPRADGGTPPACVDFLTSMPPASRRALAAHGRGEVDHVRRARAAPRADQQPLPPSRPNRMIFLSRA